MSISDMRWSRQKLLLTGAALLAALALYAANACFGDLNQDEGWYLYAARQVAKGLLPYRDFFFTQAPLTPLVFAATHGIWGGGGILGARFLNAAFGLMAAALAAWVAWRQAPCRMRFHAALTAFCLVACNIYQSYFTTVIKTYSVAAMFLMGGVLALSSAGNGRRGLWLAGTAGLLFSLAAGARVSLGMVLPVAGLYLLWRRRGLPCWSWLVFGVGAAAGMACLFGPWLLLCGEQFRFALSFHSARASGGILPALLFKAGFLSRCLHAYFVALALLGLAIAGLWWRRGRSSGNGMNSGAEALPQARLLLGMAAAVTALQIMAPFPYDDYQVPVYPLVAVVTAVLWWRLVDGVLGKEEMPAAFVIQWALLAVILGQALSSPINQSWFVRGRDRFWWLQKPKPDIMVLRDTARRLNEMAPGKGELLTQDTYLAVEAGWSVPAGFEMGPFSYFPDLSTEKARRYHVLNREILQAVLDTGTAPVAAFSGYGFAVDSPTTVQVPAEERDALFARLGRRYKVVEQVPAFGQAHTLLTLWRLRNDGPEP